MKMNNRLERLATLADVISERELSKLAELSRRRSELEANVRANRDANHRTIESATPDPAHFAGADDAWLRWNLQELKKLSEATAIAASDAEQQLVVARRAYGRALALTKLKSR